MAEPDSHPPQWPLRFLRSFCPRDLSEEIEGDLVQKYQRDVKVFGEWTAKRRFAWNAMRFFRPGIISRNTFSADSINNTMIRSYFKISMRSLLTHKGNSFINILGLVIGITAALVILVIIQYELSFDRFHTNADRIFRVVTASLHDGETEYSPGVSYPLPVALENEISSIESITSLHYHRELQVDVLDEKGTTVKKFQESNGCALVEPSFFRVFDFQDTDFKWISGNSETALSEPFSIVLTRSIAEKYFSTQDVVGRTLKIEQQLDFKVTGVIEDLPPNTDLPFTVLLSYSTFYKIQENEMKNDWRSVANVNQCFMTLPKGVDKREIEKQIDHIYAAHVPEEVAQSRTFKLQPLKEIHHDNRYGNFNLRTADKTMLWTLALTGIALLLIACINYVNLATAQSTLRSKEIGIRKVLGSRRRQLIFQFLSEAFLIAFIACLVAVVAAQLVIVQLEPLMNIKLQHYPFLDWFVLKSLLLILLIITLLAGFYPAMMVSGFDPVHAIKSRLTTPGAGAYLRKALVVMQFTVTQIFIIGTFVVLSQMDFFRNVDLGFNKEGIINVSLPNSNYEGRLEALQHKLQSIASISQVSISSSTPAGLRRASWFTGIRRKEADPNNAIGCEYQSIDHTYLGFYGIKLLAGRNFSAEDSSGYLIINQTLATKAGFASVGESIGQEMVLDNKLYTVIGVVADFHSRSLKESLETVAFAVHPHMYRLASLKFSSLSGKANASGAFRTTMGKIESVWATTFPETVFDYRFLDENIEAYYMEEIKFSRLLQLFSGVFLIIGCLGLYGLISFVVNRKLKEVAVRKVFGASMVHIMGLISRDYFKLILLAFVIAAPVTYLYMEKWLSNFVYHIEIRWWILVLPGLLVFMVALFAIGGQLLKAARSNPANTLKYE
jgi:putative ABC transport system permease protein